jgi:2-keto-4-pentenoate hydratase/2-oxohepta-3-ene-1,7-dioic acid hydratase in catechol pathway
MPVEERFSRVKTPSGPRFARLDGSDWVVLDRAPWLDGAPTGERLDTTSAQLLVPVEPSKILGVGRNYRAHAKELGNEVPAEPMLFLKPPSSLLDPGGTIELPRAEISSRVDHEAELGIVVGTRLKNASIADAQEAVFGLTIVCDVSARDLQKKDGQWWRAKGMDTFCPVGPHIVTGVDPRVLTIECRVNGAVRQHGNTSDMIFSISDVLVHVSRVMTLEPGDLIATGTPEGVGPLSDGDLLEIEIERLGKLSVHVRASA